MRHTLRTLGSAALLAAALALAGCSQADGGQGWDPSLAARYLDGRAGSWLRWPSATREHGTLCASCHTTLPYALARGELRQLLGERELAGPERRLLASVQQRVALWDAQQLLPWYKRQKEGSRGTEAVLSAVILARADAGSGTLTPATRSALEHMWATQYTAGAASGSWPWVMFNNEPWEAPDSAYYGTTLAALAVELTPSSYRQEPQVAAGSAQLADYLRRKYARQSLANRLNLLWASGRWPALMESQARQQLLAELAAAQRSDGGWSLATQLPSWKRRDGSAVPAESDGYATGFICFVLQEAGAQPSDPPVARGLAWLAAHQSRWNGRWHTLSPNRPNGWLPAEGDHFMDDAATAFASLALIRATGHGATDRATEVGRR
jgi:hypothetical protein